MKVFVQICVLSFLLASNLSGQDKVAKSRNGSEQLESVKQKVKTDPLNAIKELTSIIEKANEEEDLLTLYLANLILGDINFDNQLYELASERYTQSYNLENQIKNSSGNTVSERLGETYLNLKDTRAKQSFKRCIVESTDANQILLCKEGLSKAYYNNQEYDAATALLQELEKTYAQTDSSSLARIQALLAKNAVANNDLGYADQNIQNAYGNFKKGRAEDYEIIQESKEKVLEKSNEDFDKEAFLNSNVIITEDKPEVQAVEQLDLAKVLVEKGEIYKAEKSIENARNKINDIEDLGVKAKIFKQSSETFALKGDYESALKEYKKFQENQSASLQQKEEEINTRLAILESQKNAEISERTFSSRKKLYVAEQERTSIQRYIIYLLVLLLIGSVLAGLFIWKNLRAKNILNQKLQLQSLRSQMNPHFIFNALNSVNEFIATQDERKANKYLSDFSKLMRSVLEVNQKETIDLAEEINLSALYLMLEQSRFNDKFDHELIVDQQLRSSDVQIPPLLLQPYIENAIWHGLRYRDTKGKLSVVIKNEQENIRIEILDNGIGRKNSSAQKTKFQKQQESTGMKNTQSRMDIVEKLYGSSFQLSIDDAFDDSKYPGTLVRITFSKN